MLTARDEEILKTLALKVRMLSLDQLVQTWWKATATGKANARRRLAALVANKLLRLAHVQARPLPELSAPVAVWKPGQSEPHFGAIAWQLQSRWRSPPRRTSVYVATQKTANQFGGRLRGIIRHDLQATHDLGVAQVYLQFIAANPKVAKEWVGEDVLRLAYRRQKLPDAVLASSSAGTHIRLVIEFGGAYDAGRVRRFHQHCAAQQLPYEIW